MFKICLMVFYGGLLAILVAMLSGLLLCSIVAPENFEPAGIHYHVDDFIQLDRTPYCYKVLAIGDKLILVCDGTKQVYLLKTAYKVISNEELLFANELDMGHEHIKQ